MNKKNIEVKEALYYDILNDNQVNCRLCPHNCRIAEEGRGICGVRLNRSGMLTAGNYGKVTSIALDPIEKKPLYHFFTGSRILSIGSFGCNFSCGFCQNYQISMQEADWQLFSPKDITDLSKKYAEQGNIGMAYTYNEPLVGIEFVYDCARLIAEQGQKNVIVTNGFINEEPLKHILPYIHAMNIDLKSFNQDFYKRLGGNIDNVKRSIETAASRCHIEITTLIIPAENDSEAEMEQLAEWISSINRDIPLHVSRFFPNYRYNNAAPTPVETIYKLTGTAKKYLNYVYSGNC